MDITCFLFLMAFVVNLIHWHRLRRDQFVHYPACGYLAIVFRSWCVLCVIMLILWLLRVVRLNSALALSLTWMAGIQVYSILFRKCKDDKRDSY
jgi:hypothetical protein